MEGLIRAENICKSYSGMSVLEGISFEGFAGEILCFTGKNGCGKSTLMSMLAGVERPGSGSVFMAPGETVGYLPQSDPLITTASVMENLRLWCPDKDKILKVAEEFELDGFKKKKVGRLSGGMKRRVSLACVLAGQPRILILDEPTAALDIEQKAFIRRKLREHADGGGLVILVSHEDSEIEMADRRFTL